MNRKTISICFDDGFYTSSRAVRRIFERRDLRATFCVMGSPEQSVDIAHIDAVFADWTFWRCARDAGHDVAPHGWAHERLFDLTFEAGRASIERVLQRFEQVLPDFRADQCVFHTPYLCMPNDLLDWLRLRCAAVRLARGDGGANSIDQAQSSGLIDCVAFGPVNVAASAIQAIDAFRSGSSEWMVLVLHGLDGEGWGSLTTSELELLLDHCAASELVIRPVSDVLGSASKRTFAIETLR